MTVGRKLGVVHCDQRAHVTGFGSGGGSLAVKRLNAEEAERAPGVKGVLLKGVLLKGVLLKGVLLKGLLLKGPQQLVSWSGGRIRAARPWPFSSDRRGAARAREGEPLFRVVSPGDEGHGAGDGAGVGTTNDQG
ncbi:hypothetical protein CYMTET_49227 [Cymbomonas tetramitiformis]|uniref:Uncharacterized protein n=1 Tax=Cymbomonas tetramitiformis TaxID=36881 RepID=A0AAE0BRX1_9CHLO|nr:hypothetical protein CYMTET_49227 [Cymbomonas tetramitiformis]